ncbi:hypothetical protein [Falsiroseomonas sp. CW058]|uniref:hypothetical protein n=1 Tax=Falsiroseomonas sp. CW058 TaxID=3388664 RepID=UPI003D31C069
MSEVSRPQSSKPWLKGSPIDVALLFICAPIAALAVWHEKQALVTLTATVWIGVPAAISLWRHREGIEIHPRPGVLWAVLAFSFMAYLSSLSILIPG